MRVRFPLDPPSSNPASATKFWPLAQQAEQHTVNVLVGGSTPSGPANQGVAQRTEFSAWTRAVSGSNPLSLTNFGDVA